MANRKMFIKKHMPNLCQNASGYEKHRPDLCQMRYSCKPLHMIEAETLKASDAKIVCLCVCQGITLAKEHSIKYKICTVCFIFTKEDYHDCCRNGDSSQKSIP